MVLGHDAFDDTDMGVIANSCQMRIGQMNVLRIFIVAELVRNYFFFVELRRYKSVFGKIHKNVFKKVTKMVFFLKKCRGMLYLAVSFAVRFEAD